VLTKYAIKSYAAPAHTRLDRLLQFIQRRSHCVVPCIFEK
jgi:hypothetical protein